MDFRKFWIRRERKVPPSLESWEDEPLRVSSPPKPRIAVNIILFFLTVFTTLLAGAWHEGADPLKNPAYIFKGIPFSFSLMGILLAHELGHYLIARKHGLNVTLPYFIPAPPLPFIIGTFGAFIKMRSPVRDRKMLLDVGAAGPLVGVVVSIPFLILGFHLSVVKMVQGHMGGLTLGSSLLLSLISWLVVGPVPAGFDIVIHPVGFAGWIGLLVTSFNLLPIGQLDGGHVAYALLGERQNKISKYVFLALLALGIFGWPGWLLWGLLLFIMGFRHPPPMDWWVPLDRKRMVMGWLTVAVFILTFIPVPFSGF
ncbi:MAG: site-2 protease family protein [Thermodesulfobacteriota bacterium]|jgi:membrane-associated protease RseP (regulator of RpoE activity)